MKKILLIMLFFGGFGMQAQDMDTKEKIKALKTAYITEHLSLTSEEAEKFWPVYNRYDKTNHELRMQHRNIYCGVNDKATSSEKSSEMLQNYIALEDKRCSLRKNMLLEMANVLPPHKIINLKKVEDDFHKKLIKEYRARKNKTQN